MRVACGWLDGRMRVALGWLWGRNVLPSIWLCGGFGVALGWLYPVFIGQWFSGSAGCVILTHPPHVH